jgi:hypothetical protein
MAFDSAPTNFVATFENVTHAEAAWALETGAAAVAKRYIPRVEEN